RLVRRGVVNGDELPTAARGGEALLEKDLLARVAFLPARIGHAVLALEALPRDPRVRRRGLADLLEDVRRAAVVPIEADAARDLLDDPPVLPRLPGRLERLASELHAAVRVRERPRLLGEGGRGQDHV